MLLINNVQDGEASFVHVFMIDIGRRPRKPRRTASESVTGLVEARMVREDAASFIFSLVKQPPHHFQPLAAYF